MDAIRWTLVCIIAFPALIYTFANFCIAVRRVWLYTNSGPSWIPVVGTVAALAGILLVPKSRTLLSHGAMISFFVCLCFDGSIILADVVNWIRATITGTQPS